MDIMRYLTAVAILSLSANAAAGVALGATRVVINDGKNEGTVNIYNNDSRNFLIQSWVMDKNNKTSTDFALTPPLFKLKANTSNTLRVLLTTELPQDRESLYWLNVKFIPSTSKGSTENELTLALNNQIKIIYRPESISKNNMYDEFKKVEFRKRADMLEIKNPTVHYINLGQIKLNGDNVKTPSYIAPGKTEIISMEGHNTAKTIEYSIIDDNGRYSDYKSVL